MPAVDDEQLARQFSSQHVRKLPDAAVVDRLVASRRRGKQGLRSKRSQVKASSKVVGSEPLSLSVTTSATPPSSNSLERRVTVSTPSGSQDCDSISSSVVPSQSVLVKRLTEIGIQRAKLFMTMKHTSSQMVALQKTHTTQILQTEKLNSESELILSLMK